jgi:hypothetical protein
MCIASELRHDEKSAGATDQDSPGGMRRQSAHLTIIECRPPWRRAPARNGHRPSRRVRCTQATRIWTLYWRDRDLRFHRHDQLEPSPGIRDLLDEIDRDPTAIFGG